MNEKEVKARVIAALKHQAVADAVGNKYEFQRNPNPDHVLRDYQGDKPLNITDDTQMAMFGFMAVARGGDLRENLQSEYRRWFTTQSLPASNGLWQTGLLQYPEMFSVQAPGRTCLSAISCNFKTRNTSKGCGTVMRALPFVLYPTSAEAEMDADLTHHHKEVGVVAKEQHAYLRTLLMGRTPKPDYRGVPLDDVYGGGGWTAGDCWDIARWSFENCDGDFQKLLTLSICHGGDSDSTAAVAGAIFGLAYPDHECNRVVEEQRPLHYVVGKIQRMHLPPQV